MTEQEYYAQHGSLVYVTIAPEPLGPLIDGYWISDDLGAMKAARWKVIGNATKDDLREQSIALTGTFGSIPEEFKYFYRIEAMD